jgi:hypothetical protein
MGVSRFKSGIQDFQIGSLGTKLGPAWDKHGAATLSPIPPA